MRFLVGECLQNNILPTWNPYTNLGYPLHVDPQSGALYPIVWILGKLFGYSVYTINMEFMIHILLGFYGMKKLSEELGVKENIAIVVGLSYACCGFFVGNAQHLSWIISATWLPFIACYYLRLLKNKKWTNALWLSVFCFLIVTGGYPAFTITSFYLMGFSFLGLMIYKIRKKEYHFVKAFIFKNVLFGISFLIQSLVFLKFFLESLPFLIRTETLTLADAQLLPFSPQAFLSFIIPFVTGGHAEFFKTDMAMANGYFGLFGFLFFLLYLWKKPTWKGMLFGGLGLFFLLTAMGDYFVFREWLYEYVPMMNLFRYPALFRIFTIICFLILFGWSLQEYRKKPDQSINWMKFRAVGFTLLIALVALFIYAIQKTDLIVPDGFSAEAIVTFLNKSSNSEMILIQAPIQIILLSVLLFKSYYRKGMSFLKLAFILILVDLFLSVQLNTFLTINAEAKVFELQEKINRLPKGFPFPEKKISDVSHHGNKNYYPIWYNLNILKKEIAHNGYNNFKLKAFRVFTDQPEYMKILENKVLYFKEESIVDSLSNTKRQGLEIVSFTPNEIIAKVSLEEEKELVFLQHFYPGWKAYLNGSAIPIETKDKMFLSIVAPKGSHQIKIGYEPKYFNGYLMISFGAFLLIIGFLTVRKIRPPRQTYHKS